MTPIPAARCSRLRGRASGRLQAASGWTRPPAALLTWNDGEIARTLLPGTGVGVPVLAINEAGASSNTAMFSCVEAPPPDVPGLGAFGAVPRAAGIALNRAHTDHRPVRGRPRRARDGQLHDLSHGVPACLAEPASAARFFFHSEVRAGSLPLHGTRP